VGVLLIELYSAEPSATKDVFVQCDLAHALNALLMYQKDLSSRFSLSVMECNIMTASFFITRVTYLKEHFLQVHATDTLMQYQQNQQNFGKNIDVVIQKCLKHLQSASSPPPAAEQE
jgi:hypothetical protein